MKSERNSMRLSRRNFLLTLGAGGAASAAALVAKAPQTTGADSRDKRATRGYHVTGHVEHYYRTARV